LEANTGNSIEIGMVETMALALGKTHKNDQKSLNPNPQSPSTLKSAAANSCIPFGMPSPFKHPSLLCPHSHALNPNFFFVERTSHYTGISGL
jgi:hypothetical protein